MQSPHIRDGRSSDAPSVIAVDIAASDLFRPTGLLSKDALGDHVSADAINAAIDRGLMKVAVVESGDVAGFLMASIQDGDLYIDQISVSPDFGRRGIGTALMKTAEDMATNLGINSILLSTFRDLAWNGPFYASLGYGVIPKHAYSSFMKEVEAAQAPFMDVSLRIFMRKTVRNL
ncbi:GNAT family N-acetyltransferase [Henriciella litoralis]|uniref:GNAT family N-acetyltransferase n=1 Tax=Henriciella litoralis TaxID=568102 RepID=UPI00146B2A82|nr:GNAT family N-acetyltransferase [Henriciella litoralis]